MVQVLEIKDLEDGGAEVSLEMSHEELIELAKIGIVALLTEFVEKKKKEMDNA